MGTKLQAAIIDKICSKIYESSSDLKDEFKKISLRSSGLNYVEFVEAIKKYGVGKFLFPIWVLWSQSHH